MILMNIMSQGRQRGHKIKSKPLCRMDGPFPAVDLCDGCNQISPANFYFFYLFFF